MLSPLGTALGKTRQWQGRSGGSPRNRWSLLLSNPAFMARICICASARTPLSWAFVYRFGGRQREAGLGKAGKGGVSLATARRKAAEGRALLDQRPPIDPLTIWRPARASSVPTFAEAAADYIALHEFVVEERHARRAMALDARDPLQVADEAAGRSDRHANGAQAAYAAVDPHSRDRQPRARSDRGGHRFRPKRRRGEA